jgi:hypothetical protein
VDKKIWSILKPHTRLTRGLDVALHKIQTGILKDVTRLGKGYG